MGSRKARLKLLIFETSTNSFRSHLHILARSAMIFICSFVHGAENTQDPGYGWLVRVFLRNRCSGGHGGKAAMLI